MILAVSNEKLSFMLDKILYMLFSKHTIFALLCGFTYTAVQKSQIYCYIYCSHNEPGKTHWHISTDLLSYIKKKLHVLKKLMIALKLFIVIYWCHSKRIISDPGGGLP